LTRKQRLIGFGSCFVFGFVLSLLSFLSLSLGNVTAYAIVYTLGNLTSLLSTSFLSGFKSQQMKGMFDKKRKIASLVFLVSMILTLVVAFTTKSPGLCLIFALIQFLALFWYSLSYIPFARDVVKKAVGIN
ncbi:vesicle transport protein, partial [Blastocladiella britannica]